MSSSNLSLPRHLVSFASFALVTINLLIWLPLLLVAAILRPLLPVGLVRRLIDKLVALIYRAAVKIDAWWFSRVLGIEFALEDPEAVIAQLEPTHSPVIICNHQSWFDIFLLQTLISSNGPMLQFVIKAELLWVPVLGWICLVLNFPRLSRKVDARSRAEDRQRVQVASLTLSEKPGGLLIFPEGTRGNPAKCRQSGSEYTNLLRPKLGGLSVIRDAMNPDTQLLDMSVRYAPGEANCWRCMSGAVNKITVRVEQFQLGDIESTAQWLPQRWRAKDAWMELG